MRRLVFLMAVVAGTLILSCNGESPSNRSDAPIIDREAPEPLTTSAEPILPKSGGGNFESLVADYESKDRAIWQKPDMVISLLGDLEGKTVVDIGAGTGYFTFRMLPLADKVIGVDIDERFIARLDSMKVRFSEPYRKRFESRLAKPDDPMLKPEEADAVIIVNTYGYIENRVQYLQILGKGMKTGAELLIIDFKKNSLPIGPPEEFKVGLIQVERELKAGGFSIEKIDNEALDYQYIVLAKKI